MAIFRGLFSSTRSTSTRTIQSTTEKEPDVSNINETLEQLMQVDGAMCVAIVDSASGMLLAKAGTGMDLDVAAAATTELVRAKLNTMKALGLDDAIDDMLITLTSQYHVIRPLAATPQVFIYFALDRSKANLAMARLKVIQADAAIVL